MKLYKSLIIGAALALSATSCNDWLDINTDPNSPSAESVEYQTLLPWCQFYMSHCYMNTGCNASYYAGNIISGGTPATRAPLCGTSAQAHAVATLTSGSSWA